MTAVLTRPEFIVLEQILENKAAALLNEIAHTDDRSYLEYVTETLATVEHLQVRLDASRTHDVRPRA